MVGLVYVTADRNFTPAPRRIAALSAHGRGEIIPEAFEDFTGNFESLGIWDTCADLHNRKVVDVRTRIRGILERLKTAGFQVGDRSNSINERGCYTGWWFGQTEKPKGKIGHNGKNMFDLPVRDRTEVLMLHLALILECLAEQGEDMYLRSSRHIGHG